MIKRRTLAILFAVVAVGALALAACGGDDDSGGGTATSTAGGQVTQTTAAGNTSGATTAAATVAATATQQASSGGANPCDLLTKSDVETALGESVNDAEYTLAGDTPVSADVTATVSVCSYSAIAGISSISLDIWSAPGNDSGIKQLTQFVCSSKESVSGLGDVACWYDSDHTELQLSKGASFLDLQFTTLTGDGTELLQALAKKVIGRLP